MLQGKTLSLDVEEQKDLASYINQCQLNELNLESTEKAFNECSSTLTRTKGWWQTPTGTALILLTGVLLGFSAGSVVN